VDTAGVGNPPSSSSPALVGTDVVVSSSRVAAIVGVSVLPGLAGAGAGVSMPWAYVKRILLLLLVVVSSRRVRMVVYYFIIFVVVIGVVGCRLCAVLYCV